MPSMNWSPASPTSPLSRSALMSHTSVTPNVWNDDLAGTSSRQIATQHHPSTSSSPYRSPLATSIAFSSSPSSSSLSPSSCLPKRMPTSPPSPLVNQIRPPTAGTAVTSRQGRRRSSHHFSTSPTPNRSLVGSYSESLLSGRMSTNPSIPFPFQGELGVLGTNDGEMPRHLKLDFDARFYAMPEDNGNNRAGSTWASSYVSSPSARSFSSSYLAACNPISTCPSSPGLASTQNISSAPYVGTIDLEAYYFAILSETLSASRHVCPPLPPAFPGYEVPPKGQVQLLVKNPHLNSPVKLFLVPYDLEGMPANSKTFIRKKICVETSSTGDGIQPGPSRNKRHSVGATGGLRERLEAKPRESLRYAVHLQFACVSDTILPKKKARTSMSSRAANLYGERGSPYDPPRSHRTCTIGDAAIGEGAMSPSPSATQRYFLHKNIRVVFSPRPPDKEDVIKTWIETPAGLLAEEDYIASQLHAVDTKASSTFQNEEKRYSAFAGHGQDWESLRRKVLKVRKEWKLSAAAMRRHSRGTETIPADTSTVSLTSTASTTLEVDSSSLSIPRAPFKVEDVDFSLDQAWTTDGLPSPSEAYATNPDPNGEYWEDHDAAERILPSDMQAKVHQRWKDMMIGESPTSTLPSSAESELQSHSGATSLLYRRPLRRQRSKTITPKPPGEPERALAASRDLLPSSARSLPASSGLGPQAMGPQILNSARAASPFAPPLTLQRLSIRSASPSMAETTPTNVSGVTSPPPPLSPGVSSSSYTSNVNLGTLPYHLPTLQSSCEQLEQRALTEAGRMQVSDVQRLPLFSNTSNISHMIHAEDSAGRTSPPSHTVLLRIPRNSAYASDSEDDLDRPQSESSSVEVSIEDDQDDQALLEMWHSTLSNTRRVGSTGSHLSTSSTQSNLQQHAGTSKMHLSHDHPMPMANQLRARRGESSDKRTSGGSSMSARSQTPTLQDAPIFESVSDRRLTGMDSVIPTRTSRTCVRTATNGGKQHDGNGQ